MTQGVIMNRTIATALPAVTLGAGILGGLVVGAEASPAAPVPSPSVKVERIADAATSSTTSPSGHKCSPVGHVVTWTSPVTHRTYRYRCTAVTRDEYRRIR